MTMQLRNLNNANTSSCVLVWPIAFSRERARKRLPMSIPKGVSGFRHKRQANMSLITAQDRNGF